MPRLPFRFTPRSTVELSIAVLLALVGLILILGTRDEYKAGRAFNQAMDNYATADFEDVHDSLDDAIEAKPEYDAPQEALAKIDLDSGKFTEATALYERLQRRQEAAGGRASLPVLIGLAVARVEAARAAAASPEALRDALPDARSRLEGILATHPASGDVHVNLATVALLDGDLDRCRAELDKVLAVGNISPDALPVLYNLTGVLALRERRYDAAIAEFEKVKEFQPDWEVPKLNLAAAHAQVLNAPGASSALTNRAAAALRKILPEIRKSRGPLFARVCLALGAYSLRPQGNQKPVVADALRYFAEAEKLAKLSPQAIFNRAIAQYLDAHAASRKDKSAYNAPAAEFARALADPKSSARDRFVASCLLGTIEHERGDPKKALEHFTLAAALTEKSTDPFIRAAAPQVTISLITLHYEAGEMPKAAALLEKAEGVTNPADKKKLDALAKQFRAAPVISQFVCKREKLFTDSDLRVAATLLTPGSPNPLTPERVTLTLLDDLAGTAKPLPFQLDGPSLCAIAVNLPQGKYRAKLTLTDPFGNRDEDASDTVEIDRDPPRITKRVPEAGATVAALKTIEFSVEDTLGSVDLAAMRVMLRYPPGSSVATRTLVSGGKVQFVSGDGSIARYSDITPNVRAPVAPDKFPKGEYRVIVHVQDTLGKARDIEWSFTLAP
ncbi:MAG: hypothetical protein FJ290_19845 [Planctomycetes bacterium]|nr:hypothetical protein [Planctomycetota bacterium]